MVMKTPGVYVVEKNAFPNSVVEVATAVPAFIGYTAIAMNKSAPLKNVPWRITSLSEYHEYFGGGPMPKFTIAEEVGSTPSFSLARSGNQYLLYNSLQLFFKNGGGACYIVSVGSYTEEIAEDKLSNGIELLLKEREPTMLVLPETVSLGKAQAFSVQQAALTHCGDAMKNRVAILDIWDGYKDRQHPDGDCVEEFRSGLGINNLDYAAAYYPWLKTSVVQAKELSFENIENPEVLIELIKGELEPETKPADGGNDTPAERAAQAKRQSQLSVLDKVINGTNAQGSEGDAPEKQSPVDAAAEIQSLDKALRVFSGLYNEILSEAQAQLNLLPPAAAMAGVYTMVDNSRGVWKAPANVSLNAVVAPSVNISHDEQEDLNVHTQGKSVNAIRAFIGEGVLVWGARTLDGNSLDWRYVNVRRTMIMLEESIQTACKAYVFEPNVSNTWVTLRGMIRNFLTGIWKRGGLAGASPEEAFSVHVGLGETMTSEDILEGILKVTVLVAISRPAEFIELTFQQKMQES